MKHTFNETWQRCEPSTRKACLALTKHYHDAEDLLQTTWLKAYRSWSKKPHSLTKAYFTTVAKNAWIDEVRKKKIASVSFEDDDQSVADSTEIVTSLNIKDLLIPLVSNLTVRQQILFLLADVCRCSLKEIASLTKMSIGAVKAALFRARQKVSHEVREQLDETIALDEDEVLRVQLYSKALHTGDIQLLASLLTDTASIPALYVQQQQAHSSWDCKMVA